MEGIRHNGPFSHLQVTSNVLKFSTDPILKTTVALGIEYDGTSFHGWQIQKKPAVATVQEALEHALTKVAACPVKVLCAGRTDTGVHATDQVVHFHCETPRSEVAWIRGVNTHLPGSVAVKWAVGVDDSFHARFSATARTYRYVIYNSPVRSPVMHKKLTWINQPLDEGVMHRAAQHLLGENDFSSYRGGGCQSNTPFRFMEKIRVVREGDLIIAEITANAFLLHMVRNIMGVLIEIGLGNRPEDWSALVLAEKDRTKAAKTASPDGLYLVKAHYPAEFGLPERSLGPSFLPAAFKTRI
ncbi:tRNA pseudouridine synthase A [BD1-7 clade bacterium]|uniref:tRNA pseudouridine synthase A n=1 Tax=BD1-7 clade bacterium TaxID=2029982 RepID=A0A5S9NT87_9GAMM|nr:tRNA pseudouridine synthase A [BD1-7 clade bacterium]CAA0093797.1 tRNA pseudouridine synthase A [BD1-7 clade bacterium]